MLCILHSNSPNTLVVRVVDGIETPLFWRGVMYFQPHFVVAIISDPITVMTTWLIALYWCVFFKVKSFDLIVFVFFFLLCRNELTTQTTARPIAFLIRFRALFFTVTASLLVVTIILACLISNLGALVSYALMAIAALCVVVVVPFFVINGIRILKQLEKSPPNPQSLGLQRVRQSLLNVEPQQTDSFICRPQRSCCFRLYLF